MPKYGLYDEESGKIQYYAKDEARQELNTRLENARTDEEKQKEMADFLTGIRSEVTFHDTKQGKAERLYGDKYHELLSSDELLELTEMRKKYYEPLSYLPDEDFESYSKRTENIDKVTVRYVKAMLETNPEERYGSLQMAMLYDIK
ncbi:MAG TPA: hypothetical protein DCL38_09700 [Lachnospiraceae bacterium]|nr:hypothetical protein [Lachnospiraceae bacterium]